MNSIIKYSNIHWYISVLFLIITPNLLCQESSNYNFILSSEYGDIPIKNDIKKLDKLKEQHKKSNIGKYLHYYFDQILLMEESLHSSSAIDSLEILESYLKKESLYNEKTTAQINLLKGFNYIHIGNYDLAGEYLNLASKYFFKEKDYNNYILALIRLATVECYNGNNILCINILVPLESFIENHDISTLVKNEYYLILSYYYGLWAENFQFIQSKAKGYLEKVNYKVYTSDYFKTKQSLAYSNYYFDAKQYPRMKLYLTDGDELIRNNKNTLLGLRFLFLESLYQIKLFNNGNTEKNAEKMLEIALKNNQVNYQIHAYTFLFALNKRKANLKGEYYGNRAIEIAERYNNNLYKVRVYDVFRSYYAVLKDYKKAYEYQVKYTTLQLEIYNQNQFDRIFELENKAIIEKSELVNYQLTKQNNENEATIQRQKRNLYFAFGILGIIIFLLFSFLYIFNERTKHNKDLNTKNQELFELNRKLKIVNENLETYSRVIAHDFVSPIKQNKQIIELIKDDIKQNKFEDVLSSLTIVQNSFKKFSIVLDDIKKFTNIEISLSENKKVDLNDVLDDVFDNLALEIKESNANITYPILPKVMGQKSLYVIAFQNIISNSIKYRSKDRALNITINYKEEEKVYLISISDNGIGIPEEYHKKIFELFFRLENFHNTRGSGLGLSTVNKIISFFDQKIWLESNKNIRGTTFYFTLPKP